MTVNVNALIHSLEKTYQELVDAGLITYKTMPESSSGEPNIHLNMAKEGVFLSFKRDNRIFKEMTLRIQNEKIKNWVFPNELPLELQKEMTREWVHKKFGTPMRSIAPQIIMRKEFGWCDLYSIDKTPIPVSMQFDYDTRDFVKTITFLPTSELRW
ncbi:pyocin immunity protein [Salmonella enterica]|nr:pyocin immunity protein [Salmonella enterica]